MNLVFKNSKNNGTSSKIISIDSSLFSSFSSHNLIEMGGEVVQTAALQIRTNTSGSSVETKNYN